MGREVMLLIAATTAAPRAAEPASMTTTPSSPTWTPTLAPPPAIIEKFGRNCSTCRPLAAAAMARWSCVARRASPGAPAATTQAAMMAAQILFSGTAAFSGGIAAMLAHTPPRASAFQNGRREKIDVIRPESPSNVDHHGALASRSAQDAALTRGSHEAAVLLRA